LKTRIGKLMEPAKGKRGIALLAAAFLLQGLVACGRIATGAGVNRIAALNVTEDQKDILDMAGINTDIDIFEYRIDDSFRTLAITRELYKDGEWYSGNTMTSQTEPGEGLLSIAMDNQTGSLSISHKQGGATTSSHAMLEEEVLSSGLSSGKTWLQQDTPVRDGEEIILMVTVYDDADGMSIFDTAYYQQYPEKLAEYDYVHLIKCRFSSQTMDEAAGSPDRR